MTIVRGEVEYAGRAVGLLTILRVGREWQWSWERPDGVIVMGACKRELDAANAAGAAIVAYYDKAH